jgi:uncharacterized protein YcgI (DUF1989 family)
MNVDVQADGRLVVLPPTCREGDSILLRAEMDLVIAVTSCPTASCNAGPARPIAFEVE